MLAVVATLTLVAALGTLVTTALVLVAALGTLVALIVTLGMLEMARGGAHRETGVRPRARPT